MEEGGRSEENDGNWCRDSTMHTVRLHVKTVDRYRVHNTHNIIRTLTYEREQECMYLRIWVVECK